MLCCFQCIPYQRKHANNPESLPKKKKTAADCLFPQAARQPTRSAFSSRYFCELRLEIYKLVLGKKKSIHVVQVPRHLREIKAATYAKHWKYRQTSLASALCAAPVFTRSNVCRAVREICKHFSNGNTTLLREPAARYVWRPSMFFTGPIGSNSNHLATFPVSVQDHYTSAIRVNCFTADPMGYGK